MRTVYHIGDEKYVTNTQGSTLISTGYGDYFCLAKDFSYQGWYEYTSSPWRLQKNIAALTPLDEGEQHTLHHHLYGVRRQFQSGAEDFLVPYQKTLLYQTIQLKGRVLLTLDHREAYGGNEYGRNYSVWQDHEHLLIKFSHDGREEWLCIKGAEQVEELHAWKEQYYEQDAKRKAQSKYWVCDLLTFQPKHHVVIARGNTEAQARTRADVTSYHFQEVLSTQQQRATHLLPERAHIKEERVRQSYALASWSFEQTLQRFTHEHRLVEGIYAGLPWFFQLWSRDELISLGGLLVRAREQEHYKDQLYAILKRYMQQLAKLKEVPNRFPPTTLASVDALGWLAHRVRQAIELEGFLDFVSPNELETWYHTFVDALAHAIRTRGKRQGGAVLFTNASQETWMDTIYNDDGRPGVRVEIQALYCAVYSVLEVLAKKLELGTAWTTEKNNFIKAVREMFVVDNLILDGVAEEKDFTPRPNIFIAYEVAPELFARKHWSASFKQVTQQLYLPWGGFATLPKDHPLYQAHYTGQTNESYHRGDSWYWINALAARMLLKHDRDTYRKEIAQLVEASARDILELGFAGHASELSSAEHPEGEASPVQTWSATQYLELIYDLY